LGAGLESVDECFVLVDGLGEGFEADDGRGFDLFDFGYFGDGGGDFTER